MELDLTLCYHFHMYLYMMNIYIRIYMYMCVYKHMLLIAGAAEIVRSISLAVAHLHLMHIAHRDLKVR